MHVLVTGGAGFIGSHMVDALVARGDHVRILDALVPRVHDGAPAVTPTSGVELIEGTVIDRAVLSRALAGIDVVFHLAAYQDYLTDFSTFFLTNSVGTALLYELIVTEHLPVRKVVVASSQAVYGEGKHRCAVDGVQYPNQRSPEQLAARDWEVHCPVCNRPTEPDWTDEAVVRPHNSYAMSKRDQEDIAISLGRRYGIPSVAMRYSIVQGPRQSFRNAYSGALRSFSVRVLTGQPPVIYEDGKQLRDYVSVHDVVRANLLALDDERANYQVYNVGGNRRVTVDELAQQVIQAAGVSIEPVTSGEYRLGDTRHVFSDTAKLQALGWQPRVSLPAIVAEYLAWAAAQPDLHDSFALAHAQMLAMGVVRETRSWAPISLRSPGLSPP
jgi:dTDP-L-rhamnose 4-epimerase